MSASNWQGDTRLGVVPRGLPTRVTAPRAQGEVTGYAHGFVYVVLDGETEPRDSATGRFLPAGTEGGEPDAARMRREVLESYAPPTAMPNPSDASGVVFDSDVLPDGEGGES